MQKRRVMVALWDRTLENVMYVDGLSSWTVGYAISLIAKLLNQDLDDEEEADQEEDPDAYDVEEDPAAYALFDWSGNPLPDRVLFSQVPRPGIVIAVNRRARLERSDGLSETVGEDPLVAYSYAKLIRRHLEDQTHKGGQRVTRFLDSEESNYEPAPLNKYDVFVSYASQDEALAKELTEGLEGKGLTCFLASGQLEAGQLWQDEIREALRASSTVVLILTPHSVESHWVMCEVGACWALGTALVPATMYVDVKTVPEIISAHQCRSIETISERAALLADVYRLCRGVEEGAPEDQDG